MSVLVGRNTRLLVQGMGKHGTFHAIGCRDYGTKVVGGVTPGKGGTTIEGFPIFDSVSEAVQKTGANVTVIFVPPAGRGGRDHGGRGRRHPPHRLHHRRRPHPGHGEGDGVPEGPQARGSSGPTAPASSRPGEKCKVGIMPGHIHKGGAVGVVSRSGTLTYEAVGQLTALGIGQSTCIGIGGDPIIGTNHTDALELFNKDRGTRAIVMIGEIGGNAEEEAAAYVKKHVKKPVVGFIAGQTAPPGRRMGHAGAIIAGGKGTADEKMKAMRAAGIHVVKSPADIGAAVAKLLEESQEQRTRKNVEAANFFDHQAGRGEGAEGGQGAGPPGGERVRGGRASGCGT